MTATPHAKRTSEVLTKGLISIRGVERFRPPGCVGHSHQMTKIFPSTVYSCSIKEGCFSHLVWTHPPSHKVEHWWYDFYYFPSPAGRFSGGDRPVFPYDVFSFCSPRKLSLLARLKAADSSSGWLRSRSKKKNHDLDFVVCAPISFPRWTARLRFRRYLREQRCSRAGSFSFSSQPRRSFHIPLLRVPDLAATLRRAFLTRLVSPMNVLSHWIAPATVNSTSAD